MNEKSKLTRRDFLKVSALGAAGAVLMPSALAAAPKSAKKKSSANDTIGIGFIGLGQQAMNLLAGFLLMGQRYALLLAAVTALVDALPVFGTGTVLLPWAAACLLLGQAPRAVALAALYAVISAVRSFLEPKVMAAQAGLPPLAALAAMYAGFRAFGVAGMILLPVALLFVKQLHDQGYVGLWK